ncbi:HAD-IIB family hydrolase [Demequina aurantiaca]|uniref:HAD-IIB family hydrolase n=1 Tax=Demequina aurantiaca TaxID=676200 RepID=UPI00078509CE|nr:HAD-IIB family hydrolase [Demequina aurantiaca]
MSSPRAIFLDVDGTYASHGNVPPAHVAAVRAARAAGNLVFLCTGRPVSALPESLTGAGFDGVVGAAGAYVTIGGQVLSDVRFPTDLARRTLDALEAHDMLYIIENAEGLYTRPHAVGLIARARIAFWGPDDPSAPRHPPITAADDPHRLTFAKIVSLGGDIDLSDLAREVGPEVAVVPTAIQDIGAGAGEIYQAHINKAVGMRIAVDHLGIAVEDVVAFGDGINDLEMLEFAGTAVAIEGSDPRVLALADRTAQPPQQDGLAKAFAEMGLVA